MEKLEAGPKKVPTCDHPLCRQIPTEPVPPTPACIMTIAYPSGSPDQPTISMTKDCPSPEVALAVLLAALLRSTMPDSP
jgi:hypothetical protein